MNSRQTFRVSFLATMVLIALTIQQNYAIAQESVVSARQEADSASDSDNIVITVDTGKKYDGKRMPTAKSIKLFESRVSRNAGDAGSLIVLGQLYLRDAQERDDFRRYVKAEETFRLALKIQPGSIAAKSYLGSALQAQHQFQAALKLAEEVIATKPENTYALAMIGDAAVELGDYEKAEKSYKELERLAGDAPSVLARLASFEQLKGNGEQAIELLHEALNTSIREAQPAGQLAWYEMRLATQLFDVGKYEQATKHFRDSLKHDAENTSSINGLAMIAVANGSILEAKALYQKSLAINEAPPTLAALGDVYILADEPAKATAMHGQAEVEMRDEAVFAGQAHLREFAMFLTDHDRELPKALELARADLATRKGIHAWDTLAWALHKNGKQAEAQSAIKNALALGTRDAKISFHAGMIFEAAGELEKSRAHFLDAIELNPAFSILQAEIVREKLEQ